MSTGQILQPFQDRIEAPPPVAFPVVDARCTVIGNRSVNERYRHLVMDAPATVCDAKAGQFVHLLCPPVGADEPFLRRPMSVYRTDPARGRIEFLYNVVGSGTRALAALKAGDTVMALGPLGAGFTSRARQSRSMRCSTVTVLRTCRGWRLCFADCSSGRGRMR